MQAVFLAGFPIEEMAGVRCCTTLRRFMHPQIQSQQDASVTACCVLLPA